MPATMTIIRGRDFLQTTPEGELDLESSMVLLEAVAVARTPPKDFDILLDLRRVQWRLGTLDIYELAANLASHSELRRTKIAVLVLPGPDFDNALFFETCSVNRGMTVDAFTNFEDAIQWFFTRETGEVAA
jgi:hypothetical protein